MSEKKQVVDEVVDSFISDDKTKDRTDRNVLQMYSVYDIKSEMYDVPFFALNDHMAKRKFVMDVQSRRANMISAFQDDFVLTKLGTFVFSTGEVNFGISVIIRGTEVAEK
jgi:hypothetical protein